MNGSKENLLEMHHITKRFAKIVANDDVSLEIRKGEIHALLGENLSLIHILFQILVGVCQMDEKYLPGQKVTAQVFSGAF